MSAVEFDNVSIVFGDAPKQALPLMDEGLERAEIQSRTGQVLGVHDCSLTVEHGETQSPLTWMISPWCQRINFANVMFICGKPR